MKLIELQTLLGLIENPIDDIDAVIGGKDILTPNHIQRIVADYGIDNTIQYFQTQIPEDQKQRIADGLRKWLVRNEGHPLRHKLAGLLFTLDGSRV